MTQFRILGNGHRRQLGNGAIRAIREQGSRYFDVSGSTSLGVGIDGRAVPVVPMVGQTWLSFSLSANLSRAGMSGSAQLVIGIAGALSSIVSIRGTTMLGVNLLGSLTKSQQLIGNTELPFFVTGNLIRSLTMVGSTDLSIDLLGQIAVAARMRGNATLTIGLRGFLSTKAGKKWIETWTNFYTKRQAVLNKIDENNHNLAKNAGDAATAAADAIIVTNTRVDQAENAITAQGERTTLLESKVNDPTTGLNATATALNSLNNKVTLQNNQIVAQAEEITKVRASVGSTSGNLIANAGFESDTFGWTIVSDSLVGNVSMSSYKLYRNKNGQRPGGINVLSWASDLTLSSGVIIVQSNPVPAVAGKRYCVQLGANRSGLSTLSVGIDFLNSGGGIISSAATFSPAPGYGIESAFAVAPANTVSLRLWLRSQVTGTINSPIFSIIQPMVSIVADEQVTVPPWQPSASGVDQKYAQITQQLSVEVSDLGPAKAIWGMYLDVNGRVVGMQSINDGVRGEINFMTDAFRIMSPVGAINGMEWQSGYLRTWAGSSQAVLGAGFGTDNLMLYLGPNVGAGSAKKSNAAVWADKDGNAGFSGSIMSSVISSSAIALASTRIFCGGTRTAPFVIKDVVRSSGSIGNKTTTSRTLIAPDNGSGYDYSRLSEKVKDVYLTIMSVSGGGSGNETYIIEVQKDGGAWEVLGSETVGVISTVTHVFTYTYTTPSSWSTIAFRARTTQAHTYHLVLNVEVQNFNTTGSAPGSFSDNSVAPPPPPPPPPGTGGGSYCVDYETSMLPDGRMVRDLQVGDAIACWDDCAEHPCVEMQQVRAFAIGDEECFELVSASGGKVIQSRSTPMTLRDGRTAYTPDMLGEDVLVWRADGRLAWEPVVSLASVGMRKVVKLNVGNRMYFAGTEHSVTIATHNIAKQDIIQQPV